MKTSIYGVYSNEHDITTIFLDTFENEEVISTEVKGFYFGKPNDNDTQEFYGRTKAEF